MGDLHFAMVYGLRTDLGGCKIFDGRMPLDSPISFCTSRRSLYKHSVLMLCPRKSDVLATPLLSSQLPVAFSVVGDERLGWGGLGMKLMTIMAVPDTTKNFSVTPEEDLIGQNDIYLSSNWEMGTAISCTKWGVRHFLPKTVFVF